MIKRGGETCNICGDVRKDLWRRLVIVTDLEKNSRKYLVGSKKISEETDKQIDLPMTCCHRSPVW